MSSCARNTGSTPRDPSSRLCSRRYEPGDQPGRESSHPLGRGGGFPLTVLQAGFFRRPSRRSSHAATHVHRRLFRRYRRRTGNAGRPPLDRPRRLLASLSRRRDALRLWLRADQGSKHQGWSPGDRQPQRRFRYGATANSVRPLVAVGREPEPAPWHGLSYAPLQAVALRYAAAGAEVWDIPGLETMPAPATRKTAP